MVSRHRCLDDLAAGVAEPVNWNGIAHAAPPFKYWYTVELNNKVGRERLKGRIDISRQLQTTIELNRRTLSLCCTNELAIEGTGLS